jgi:hypothetical protein
MTNNIRPLALIFALVLLISGVSNAAVDNNAAPAHHGASFLPSQADQQDQAVDTLAKKKKKKKKKKSHSS